MASLKTNGGKVDVSKITVSDAMDKIYPAGVPKNPDGSVATEAMVSVEEIQEIGAVDPVSAAFNLEMGKKVAGKKMGAKDMRWGTSDAQDIFGLLKTAYPSEAILAHVYKIGGTGAAMISPFNIQKIQTGTQFYDIIRDTCHKFSPEQQYEVRFKNSNHTQRGAGFITMPDRTDEAPSAQAEALQQRMNGQPPQHYGYGYPPPAGMGYPPQFQPPQQYAPAPAPAPVAAAAPAALPVAAQPAALPAQMPNLPPSTDPVVAQQFGQIWMDRQRMEEQLRANQELVRQQQLETREVLATARFMIERMEQDRRSPQAATQQGQQPQYAPQPWIAPASQGPPGVTPPPQPQYAQQYQQPGMGYPPPQYQQPQYQQPQYPQPQYPQQVQQRPQQQPAPATQPTSLSLMVAAAEEAARGVVQISKSMKTIKSTMNEDEDDGGADPGPDEFLGSIPFPFPGAEPAPPPPAKTFEMIRVSDTMQFALNPKDGSINWSGSFLGILPGLIEGGKSLFAALTNAEQLQRQRMQQQNQPWLAQGPQPQQQVEQQPPIVTPAPGYSAPPSYPQAQAPQQYRARVEAVPQPQAQAQVQAQPQRPIAAPAPAAREPDLFDAINAVDRMKIG